MRRRVRLLCTFVQRRFTNFWVTAFFSPVIIQRVASGRFVCHFVRIFLHVSSRMEWDAAVVDDVVNVFVIEASRSLTCGGKYVFNVYTGLRYEMLFCRLVCVQVYTHACRRTSLTENIKTIYTYTYVYLSGDVVRSLFFPLFLFSNE